MSSSEAFKGQVVLVTGVSGVVGAGVAKRLLLESATVIALVSREESAVAVKQSLSDFSDKLDTYVVDICDEGQVSKLAGELKSKYGEVNHVVGSIGGPWQLGPIFNLSADQVLADIRQKAVANFVALKHFFPLLKRDPASSYTMVSGGLSEVYIEGLGLGSFSQGALSGLSIAARGELKEEQPRLNEFRIAAFIKKAADVDPSKEEFSNDKLAQLLLRLVKDGGARGQVMKVFPPQLKDPALE